METSVTELPDSRVEVEVEVPAEDVERAASARRPGAGPGDAAARLPQGQGAAVAGDPAARLRRRCSRRRSASRCPSGTKRALLDSGVSPIGDPEHRDGLDSRGRGRAARASSSRSACGRRRSSASTRASRSARPRPRCPRRSSTREIERIREGFARLEPVERAAAEGDVAADRLRGPDRRQGLRGRQGRATTCWSSAAAS